MEKFQRKDFKHIIALFFGNFTSKVVIVLGGIILAKYYGVQNYGVYNFFSSMMLIASMVATLRLENIIVLLKDGNEIRNAKNAVIVLGAGLLFCFYIFSLFGYNFFYNHSFLVSIAFLLCAIGSLIINVYTEFYTKYRFFNIISYSTIAVALLSVILQGLFLLFEIETGLIFGLTISTVLIAAYLVIKSKSRYVFPDFNLFKNRLKDFQEIIKFTLASDILNVIGINLFPIIIYSFFTTTEAGVFSMSLRIISLPSVIVSLSVGRVFYRKAALINRNGHPKELLQFTYKTLLYVGLLNALILIIINTVGLYYISWILGPSWVNLDKYMLLLSIWIFAGSLISSITQIVIIIKKNHYFLIFNICLVLISFISFYLGHLKNDLTLGAMIFSILSAIAYIILLLSILNALKT